MPQCAPAPGQTPGMRPGVTRCGGFHISRGLKPGPTLAKEMLDKANPTGNPKTVRRLSTVELRLSPNHVVFLSSEMVGNPCDP